MTIIDLLILALATWRLSSLIVNERGPWHVFQHIRERFGIGHDESGLIAVIPPTFMGELLTCLWCCSCWVGAAVAVMLYFQPVATIWLVLPLALSGAAVVIEQMVRH